MSKFEGYRCTLCKVIKGEANHWFIAIPFGSISKATLVQFEFWSDTAADASGTTHLCGEACAHKFMDSWMRSSQ